MRPYAIALLLACCLAAGLYQMNVAGQAPSSAASHISAAKAAAGSEHTALIEGLCSPLPDPLDAPPPPRSQWHADPVKVFDNLYFVGMTEYSAWAVTTSQGIIIIDALYDYSVEDEVVGGLRRLGLDPAQIKYVLVSHGHSDHVGGASYLQERFGARVILSSADWDLVATDRGTWPKPKRDIVAVDGQRLTLGDTTLTLYLTPGHTAGTISTFVPVKDNGTPHLAAAWGGTPFNWTRPSRRSRYITPDRPDTWWFDAYSSSAKRFRDIVTSAGADVLISNHTNFDGSKTKLPALANRKARDSHPYVIGNDSVRRYVTVADECAQAGLLNFK